MGTPLVINLAAGPGAGKSTTAAALFAALKKRNLRVELVTEYAKDLTYEQNFMRLNNQLLILAEQYHRLCRVKDSVDFIVTDSPLFLSRFYGPAELYQLTELLFSEFNNVVFYIARVKPYQTYGRSQTEDEAKALDSRILAYLSNCQALDNRPFWRVVGNESADIAIINQLEAEGLLKCQQA